MNWLHRFFRGVRKETEQSPTSATEPLSSLDTSNKIIEKIHLNEDAAICTAAEKWNLSEVEDLLKTDYSLIKARARRKWTPLHFAANNGHKEIVELLLGRGGEVDAVDDDGITPLHAAAFNGGRCCQEIMELLLTKGAKIDAKNCDGKTPLHYAVGQTSFDPAAFLIAKSANLNSKDKEGSTPLHYAASENTKIVGILLDNGADVNSKNHYDETPLHVAAAHGKAGVAKLLLMRGAEVNAKNKNGHTPLTFAGQIGDQLIWNLLIAKGGKR